MCAWLAWLPGTLQKVRVCNAHVVPSSPGLIKSPHRHRCLKGPLSEKWCKFLFMGTCASCFGFRMTVASCCLDCFPRADRHQPGGLERPRGAMGKRQRDNALRKWYGFNTDSENRHSESRPVISIKRFCFDGGETGLSCL